MMTSYFSYRSKQILTHLKSFQEIQTNYQLISNDKSINKIKYFQSCKKINNNNYEIFLVIVRCSSSCNNYIIKPKAIKNHISQDLLKNVK